MTKAQPAIDPPAMPIRLSAASAVPPVGIRSSPATQQMIECLRGEAKRLGVRTS
jgi:hypothetical protein